MAERSVLQQLVRKNANKERIAERVIRKPSLLPEVFEGLAAEKAAVKYGCARVLQLISERSPKTLYPRIGFFLDLMGSENMFHKWGAIHIIGNLAAVDSRNRIERAFRRYFAPLPGPELVTAAKVVGGAAKLAAAKPKLSDRIARELLKVEKASYKTCECRKVALGHVIKALEQFFDQLKDKKPVERLVKRQLKNTRASTRKRAEKFVAKHGL